MARPASSVFISTSKKGYFGSSDAIAPSTHRWTASCCALRAPSFGILKDSAAGAFRLKMLNNILSPHERRELHETHLRPCLQFDLLIQRFRLMLIDENKKSISLKRLAGQLELLFPVDVAAFFQLETVEGLLSAHGLHQAAEMLGAFAVVVLHLLIDPAANHLAHGDFFGEDVQRQLVERLSAGRFIANSERRRHGFP